MRLLAAATPVKLRSCIALLTLAGCSRRVGGVDSTRGPDDRAALKAQGYATGQFGKNHLGDRDEHLRTADGFDEFFGNLYHLNAGCPAHRPA